MPATIFDRETHPSVRLSECEKDFSQNASNHFRSGNCRSCYCRSCYCRSCYCRSCYCCSCYCCSRRPGTPYIHPLCSRAYETRSGRNRALPLESRGLHVARTWRARGAATWRARGAHVARTWRARGAHVALTWRSRGGHVARAWRLTWRARGAHSRGAHLALNEFSA